VANNLTVIPERAKREPGIHNNNREYGFGVCAFGASRNDEGNSDGYLWP
jgi:hypothetical protein